MVVVVYQSVRRGLGPARATFDDVLPAREVVSGKENGLRLRLGSGFRCGVMENGGRFHGHSAHTPDTPTSTFPERPSKFKLPQAPGAGGALTARSPTLAYSVVPLLFMETSLPKLSFFSYAALSLARLRPREGQLTAASSTPRRQAAKCLHQGLGSSPCPARWPADNTSGK